MYSTCFVQDKVELSWKSCLRWPWFWEDSWQIGFKINSFTAAKMTAFFKEWYWGRSLDRRPLDIPCQAIKLSGAQPALKNRRSANVRRSGRGGSSRPWVWVTLSSQGFFGGGGFDPSPVLGLFVMQNSDSGAFLAQKTGNCNSEKSCQRTIVPSFQTQSKPTDEETSWKLMTFSHGVINDYISAMNYGFVSLLFSKCISLILK